jgi:hypothetical protein
LPALGGPPFIVNQFSAEIDSPPSTRDPENRFPRPRRTSDPCQCVRLEAQQDRVTYLSYFWLEGDPPILQVNTLRFGSTGIVFHRYSRNTPLEGDAILFLNIILSGHADLSFIPNSSFSVDRLRRATFPLIGVGFARTFAER